MLRENDTIKMVSISLLDCAGRRDRKPVLLVMTSNAPDSYYTQLLENYRQTLSRFVGPARVLVSGNTLQLKDYGRTDWEWNLFDPEDKRIRHETVFPQECKKAFEMGKELAGE